jgi:hypothetical protein
VKKTGTIEALNVSPEGFYEGFQNRQENRSNQSAERESSMADNRIGVGE